jgi:hypothetical protein
VVSGPYPAAAGARDGEAEIRLVRGFVGRKADVAVDPVLLLVMLELGGLTQRSRAGTMGSWGSFSAILERSTWTKSRHS